MFARAFSRAGGLRLAAILLTLALALPAVVFADDVSNNLDLTVDATAESMLLTAGGTNGTAQLRVIATGTGPTPNRRQERL